MTLENLLLHPKTRAAALRFLTHPGHGLLVRGEAGSGKRALAEALSRELLKGSPAVSLRNGRLLIVESNAQRSEITLEDIAPIQSATLLKRPGTEQIKWVCIIDQAHLLNREAQNRLLKILEEPPPWAVFILTASLPHRLLPTVRSRLWNLEIMPVGLALAVKFFGRRQDAIRKEWNLSGGNAGLLSGLIEQAQRHPLAEAIAEAKELLTTDAFHRLTMADKFSFRPRPQNADLLQALQKILAALHHNAVKQNKPALARRLAASRQQTERAARRLEASANQKLLLTDLLLKI